MGFWTIIYNGNDHSLRLHAYWRLLRAHFSRAGHLASDELLTELPHPTNYPAPSTFPSLTSRFPEDQLAAIFVLDTPPDLALIHDYESTLIDSTLHTLTTQGPIKAREALLKELHLSNQEASTLLRLARREAFLRVAGTDLEEHRASFILRLNSYIDRARQSLDLNRELQAMKLLSQALHITSAPPTSSNEQDFIDVIYSASKTAQRPIRQIQ